MSPRTGREREKEKGSGMFFEKEGRGEALKHSYKLGMPRISTTEPKRSTPLAIGLPIIDEEKVPFVFLINLQEHWIKKQTITWLGT